MTESAYRAVAAAGLLATEESHRRLLQSIVEVARAIFRAKAASVFLLDDETDELVFEAVSGEGEGELIGMRVPSSTGIAGWVLVTRQPLVVDDLSADPRHARQTAEATGYVPKALVAVPLLADDRAIGVLSVLDRADVDRPFSLVHPYPLPLIMNVDGSLFPLGIGGKMVGVRRQYPHRFIFSILLTSHHSCRLEFPRA